MLALDGHHELDLHHILGPRQIEVIGELAPTAALHCTAMGQVLVAFAPRNVSEELVATLELPRLLRLVPRRPRRHGYHVDRRHP